MGDGRRAAAYSIVRFVEAYGLWRERTWAEWFALISGALYVPFEVYELVRRPTLIHVAVLLINLAVVFYMLYLRLSAPTEAEKKQAVIDLGGTAIDLGICTVRIWVEGSGLGETPRWSLVSWTARGLPGGGRTALCQQER